MWSISTGHAQTQQWPPAVAIRPQQLQQCIKRTALIDRGGDTQPPSPGSVLGWEELLQDLKVEVICDAVWIYKQRNLKIWELHKNKFCTMQLAIYQR